MKIRAIEERDTEAVSAICMASFSKSVADTLSEEGISTFAKISASGAFLKRMKEDNLILVAECNGEIEGVIELKEGRHVAMLFVKPEKQMKGIGRKLLSSALTCAKFDTVTVSASLSSVPAYKKYGFELKGNIAESAGLVYQPMEIELNKSIQATTIASADRSVSLKRRSKEMNIITASINDSEEIAKIVAISNRDVAEKFNINRQNNPKHPSFYDKEWVLSDFERGEEYFLYRENENL